MEPRKQGILLKKPYITDMSDEETKWEHIFTGADFPASLLRVEIENIGVQVKVRSNKDAGLHSGFGPSGFAQLYVRAEDKEKVTEVVRLFEEKMK